MIARSMLALASMGRLSILIFHRAFLERDPLFPGEPTAAEFDALLDHRKRRFSILPLAEGISRLHDHTLPAPALAVTFDDGYADNLAVAAPLLRKHGIPATLFVATGYSTAASCGTTSSLRLSGRRACRSWICKGWASACMRSDRRSVGDWPSTTCWRLKYWPHGQRERERGRPAGCRRPNSAGSG